MIIDKDGSVNSDDSEGIICPYCLDIIKDTFDFKEEGGQITNCDNCGKDYMVSQIISITYASEKWNVAPDI